MNRKREKQNQENRKNQRETGPGKPEIRDQHKLPQPCDQIFVVSITAGLRGIKIVFLPRRGAHAPGVIRGEKYDKKTGKYPEPEEK